jgi:hypothetical protein
LDKPQIGFASIVFALVCISASIVSGACGMYAAKGYTWFEDAKGTADCTASFDPKSGGFQLNNEGQLKWVSKSQSTFDKSVDPLPVDSSKSDSDSTEQRRSAEMAGEITINIRQADPLPVDSSKNDSEV